MSELNQEQQLKELAQFGDWLTGKSVPPSQESYTEYIRSKFESIFNKYFRLEIIDKEQFDKLYKMYGK